MSAPAVPALYPAIAEELRASLLSLEKALSASRSRPPPDALAVCCKQAGLAFLGLILCLLIFVLVNFCLPLACLCFMGCRLFRCRQPNPVQLQQQAATTLFHAELFTAQLKFPPTLGLIPEPWDVETKRALSEDRQLCVRCKGS